jgi:hypothetical protein
MRDLEGEATEIPAFQPVSIDFLFENDWSDRFDENKLFEHNEDPETLRTPGARNMPHVRV